MKIFSKSIVSTFLSAILIFLMMISSVSVFYAETVTNITYQFSGNNKDDRGYAQGTISLSGEKGTYWLYWADDTQALSGYKEFAKLQLNESTVSHTMYQQTAIPVNAKKVIAIYSDAEPENKTVSNASAIYEIPEEKRWNFNEENKKYSFMSVSDIHIDCNYWTDYVYDDENWAGALDMAVDKDVDFIISSGDNINSTQDMEGIYIAEWRKYQKILAQSGYCNPIYEAIGNHEVFQGVTLGTQAFIEATGLDGSNNTSNKAYFEKEIMGDHFIFMSLEGGAYPDRVEEFTIEQLEWLEGLLKKYSGDGKNIYIIEHSPFYKYGAGDRIDDEPYYDIPLKMNFTSNVRFKNLLKTYKDTIFITGHTHIAFQHQFNYSDNDGTSAQMIHNSSLGGTREIINGSLDRNHTAEESEAFIVDVYDDVILFNGANVYYKEYDPNYCYLVNTSQQRYEEMSSTDPTAIPTESTTETKVLEASDIYLKGSFNGWGSDNPLYSTSNSTVYTTTLQLSQGTYEFKLNKGSDWYGNTGTIADTTTATSQGGWVMDKSSGNCKLTASGGYYQFDFDTSTNKLKVFYYSMDVSDAKESVGQLNVANTEVKINASLTGDVDGNGRVSITDATNISLAINNIQTLTPKQNFVADVNFDGELNVKDVTSIQKYVARLITAFDETDDAKLRKALLSAKNNLDLYYRYSSYDCYQTLKREYFSAKALYEEADIIDINTQINVLSHLENELLSIVDTDNVDTNETEYIVYFENSEDWANVYAYCWDSKNKNASWPGEKCTLAEINSEGNEVYEYKVDTEKYDYVIFSNGNDKQTKDIYLTDNKACYNITSNASPYEVSFTINK